MLSKFGIRLLQVQRPKIEIQSDDLRRIARFAVSHLPGSSKRYVVVEDSGLFIRTLNGFPGPFSSYVHSTIGTDGILQLMKKNSMREAYFQAIIALSAGKNYVKVFSGRVRGRIAPSEQGNVGFGFDPIFVPEGTDKTFGEMTVESKNLHSHRGIAFRRLAKWCQSRACS